MKKIPLYLALLLLVLIAGGCEEKDSKYGDDGVPRINDMIDPTELTPINEALIGQYVQFVGENLRSVSKIMINDVEVPIGGVTKLRKAMYMNIPRLASAESYVMTLENDFGTTTFSLGITFPPFSVDGILNEFALPGGELILLGESMDLYAVAGVSKVLFGTLEATVTEVSETQVKVMVPVGATNKSVVKFVSDATGEVTCPVRYMDDTYIIENLENATTTRYPERVVPNATYPAPLSPAPTEGNQYARIVTTSTTSGTVNMVGNYSLTIPESYFTTDADNYVLKFELYTIIPIAYRLAVSLNQGGAWYGFGPSSATTDPALMLTTGGAWKTMTIPMTTWKNKSGIKNLRIWIGSQPTGVTYDFCVDNFRLQPIAW